VGPGETDPLDPDTDDGGISDGDEVSVGTDPLDGSDDSPQEVVVSGGALGGCAASVDDGTTSSLWLFALIGLLGLSRRRLPLLLLVLVVLPAMSGTAQAQALEVQNLRPATDQGVDYLHLQSARPIFGQRLTAGLFTHYVDDPLVLSDTDGNRLGSLVSGQMTSHILLSAAFLDQFRVGLDLPIVLHQSGDQNLPMLGDLAVEGAGFGEVRLLAQMSLYTESTLKDPLGSSVAVALDMGIPTGDPEKLRDDGWRVEARVLFDHVFGNGTAIGSNLGYELRSPNTLLNLTVDDMLSLGLAAAVPLTERLTLVPELNARIGLVADTLDVEENPVEGVVALKYAVATDWMASIGAGMGLVRGYGAPDWRALLGLTWQSGEEPDRDLDGIIDRDDKCPDDPEDKDNFEDTNGCPDIDNDQDTVLDVSDRCPMTPEDKDGFQDADGCPDPDNDEDAILDVDDKCPLKPEDKDGFEDANGCPDPDNDQDGVLDVADKCPLKPEDKDRFQDADGCPDPDNDKDGILDVVDKCPIDPENKNGFEDTDGCPDKLTVVVTCEKLVIDGKIYFATAKAIIRKRSYSLLDEIAETLVKHSEIKSIRIEGHTDDRGSDSYNLKLSDARAASVRKYMIGKGVVDNRIVSKGYGESKPIETNKTRKGRAQNRRVEFVIVERDGCKLP